MSYVDLYQLFDTESSTYTYILVDSATKDSIVIDSVFEKVERDLGLIQELDLKLVYCLETHIHADHITGADEIRKRTGAKVAVARAANIGCADILLDDGQDLIFGKSHLKAIATPGHTNSCMSYYLESSTRRMVFTGDTLLIRTCGRTDFQQGSSEKLFQSVHEKLYGLPDDTIVYPGHDYRGFTSSSIAVEKKLNARLSKDQSLEGFKKIMAGLNLAMPKKINEAVPANMSCGRINSKT